MMALSFVKTLSKLTVKFRYFDMYLLKNKELNRAGKPEIDKIK